MSHVLLSGETDRYPGLRTLLMGWGATVGDYAGRKRSGFPDLGECDLVIHLCSTTVVPGAMPDGFQAAGGAAAGAAPLLVLGGSQVVAGAFATVPDPGPEGILLRAALAEGLCLGRRRKETGGPDRRLEQLQFLGHELRSPLAAIKTALDVICREPGFDPGADRMLEIAVRNVERLTATVEWSQDLKELEEAPPAARLEVVPLAEVIRHLESAGWIVSRQVDSSRMVLTDPRLLAQLVGQLGRVLDSVYAQKDRQLVLDGGDGAEGLRLALLTSGLDRPVGGLQTGRPAEAEAPSGDPASTIRRLIDVMVAPFLQEVLGVLPAVLVTTSGPKGIGIDLPQPRPVSIP